MRNKELFCSPGYYNTYAYSKCKSFLQLGSITGISRLGLLRVAGLSGSSGFLNLKSSKNAATRLA